MMPAKLRIIDQPIYWPRFGGKSLLAPLEPFIQSSNYRHRGVTVPGSAREAVASLATVEDQISMTPGSFLTQISAIGSAAPNDFRFEIIDLGSKQAVSSQMLRYSNATGVPDGLGNELAFILPNPLAITSPGTVHFRISNLAQAVNNICLYLQFAEPMQ